MRLSTIKLAGFKSFVDPTTLHLPTNMIGIVGPNGCGKSNIIDAIRWVMGESAASRLRGDSLTDVIFSGSSSRKPVGTALVELIFDNSDGAVGGEYARFSEISVKRTVSRDSISTYYLNGARCRRRDILDVFLGTGLGARSYSIIEQGMISQIVEARPEDLRMHLEEAAGISRYKERRRETESRIKATRENLNRVRDQAQEIGRQCEHLQRQAKAAERYQRLQREHEQVAAELKLLELRALEAELAQREAELRGDELELEKSLAEQRRVEAELERFRGRQQSATDGFNAAQADVYRVGAEIARIEQQIAHRRELAERLARSAQEIAVQIAAIAGHLDSDAGQIDELRATLADAEPALASARELVEQGRAAQSNAEVAIGDWQARWDEYAKVSGEAAKLAEVERTRIDYLDRQAVEVTRRREALSQESGQFDLSALTTSVAEIEQSQLAAVDALKSLQDDLDARRSRGDDAARRQRELLEEQASLRSQIESTGGRL
ncbi:MAG: AAA family ATPase, partial [Lysobacterales bacterium]